MDGGDEPRKERKCQDSSFFMRQLKRVVRHTAAGGMRRLHTYTVGTITKRTSLSLSDEAGLRTARVEKKSGLRAKRTSAIHCTRAKELYYNSTTNSGGNELPFLYREQ